MSGRLDAAVTPELPPARNTADPTGYHGVGFSVAHSATGQHIQPIPENLRGRLWTLLAVGAHCQCAFVLQGATAPVLVYGAASALGVGEPTRGITVLDGQPLTVFCPATATGIVYVSSSAASGFFEGYSSGRRTAMTPASR